MPEPTPSRLPDPEPGQLSELGPGAGPGQRFDLMPSPESGHVADPLSGRSPDQVPGWSPSLVDQVALEAASVSWPAPQEIRARARRRNRIRSAAGTVAVVVAVTAGSVGLVERYGGQPGPAEAPALSSTPRPIPTSTPTSAPFVIPPSALVQPEDVGPGLVVDRVDVQADAPVDLIDPSVVIDCPGYGAYERYDGLARLVRRHTVQQPPTVPDDPQTGQAVVHERVFRLAPDAAPRVFADARAVPDLCARYVSSGVFEIDGRRLPVDAEHRWRVLAEGFAGDESVLLEWQTTIRRQDTAAVVDGSAGRLIGVVRVGDLVAAVDRVDEMPDPQRARALTVGAAGRLCEVANPRC
ncbi:hypothetical protein [Plantactinospora endophytica]|uniref:Uncharacterized protein n=1 Tax=Plantactinospora endophytica TaxID=673535 RepID=A0ABQ4DTF8_9ACTN|nr:hypothetical protein [Plantactinospora endophytica]GIG85738.1 hypothetical protein Pen02_06740 [Plantactinospora endophytica]